MAIWLVSQVIEQPISSGAPLEAVREATAGVNTAEQTPVVSAREFLRVRSCTSQGLAGFVGKYAGLSPRRRASAQGGLGLRHDTPGGWRGGSLGGLCRGRSYLHSRLLKFRKS